MKRTDSAIAVIHFQPLELFPPVINLLNFLVVNAKEKVLVLSTQNQKKNRLPDYRIQSKNIEIKRTPAIIPGSAFRVFNYLRFYIYTLCILLKTKPSAVLYIDTLSSWPALLFKKLSGDKVRLLVHYHEYTTPEEYAQNMRLVRWMHHWETKMYRNAYIWISHTNEIRLEKFKVDHSLQKINSTMFRTMPNYPSEFWAGNITQFGSGIKTRLVYIGALGYDTMYLQETINWVLLNNDILSIDVYAYNIDSKSKNLLNATKDNSIRFLGGCNYNDLPGILKNYDVGLVLYKPYSENMIHNISNKVYEYLACGLDVWFPKDMRFTLSLARDHVYPKIIPVDFTKLSDFDFKSAVHREGLQSNPTEYYYEKVYGEIYENMRSAS